MDVLITVVPTLRIVVQVPPVLDERGSDLGGYGHDGPGAGAALRLDGRQRGQRPRAVAQLEHFERSQQLSCSKWHTQPFLANRYLM